MIRIANVPKINDPYPANPDLRVGSVVSEISKTGATVTVGYVGTGDPVDGRILVRDAAGRFRPLYGYAAGRIPLFGDSVLPGYGVPLANPAGFAGYGTVKLPPPPPAFPFPGTCAHGGNPSHAAYCRDCGEPMPAHTRGDPLSIYRSVRKMRVRWWILLGALLAAAIACCGGCGPSAALPPVDPPPSAPLGASPVGRADVRAEDVNRIYERVAVARVVDGDTIVCRVDLGLDTERTIRVRLLASPPFDAVELGSERGRAAAADLDYLIKKSRGVRLRTVSDATDVYGRTLAVVELAQSPGPSEWHNAADLMRAAGWGK